jgi:pimeloyl-ACP methyl ester carboxylesterase
MFALWHAAAGSNRISQVVATGVPAVALPGVRVCMPLNARTVATLMYAIDRFRRPRPESVLTSAELAAITTPAIFILGSDDPYLSIERAALHLSDPAQQAL